MSKKLLFRRWISVGIIGIYLCAMLIGMGVLAEPILSNERTLHTEPTISIEPTISSEPTTNGEPSATHEPTAANEPEPTNEPPTTQEPPTNSDPTEIPSTPAPGVPQPEASESAPECGISNCEHIGVDEAGEPIALCPLGEWKLAHANGELPSATETALVPMPLAIPINPSVVVLPNGSYTIYRSGTYSLSGGGGSCELIISPGILVSLKLADQTVIGTLTLRAETVAEIVNDERASIGALNLETNAAATFMGRGALTVSTVNGGQDRITVTGGSVNLPAGVKSSNGLVRCVFSATDTTSATVNGETFKYYTRPCSDGNAYLWLAPLPTGQVYESQIDTANQQLKVSSSPPAPTTMTDFSLSSSDSFLPSAGMAYRIVAEDNPLPQDKLLQVNVSNVKLVMESLYVPSIATVQADQPVSLHLTGTNAFGKMTGSQKITIAGSGSLSVNTISCGAIAIGSNLTLCFDSQGGGSFAGWQSVAVTGGSLTKNIRATLNDRNVGLAFCTVDPATALLPIDAPPSGQQYQAVLVGNELRVTTVPLGDQALVLGTNHLPISASGSYRITSSDSASGNIIVNQNVKATITLSEVKTSGRLELKGGAQVTLKLSGSNRMGGGMHLIGGSRVNIDGTGALFLQAVTNSGGGVTTSLSNTTNIGLGTGNRIAGSTKVPTILNITDSNGAAIANKQIVLKLGRETPFTTTTDCNGHVTLWRQKALTNIDAVVLSDANTYATIVVGGAGDPDTRPTISNVTNTPYNAVTYTVTGAQTSGIQYYINRAGVNMPDTFMADAKRVLISQGECNIPGLKNNDIVTYRVFATAISNVTLNAETADAFAFSEQYTFTAAVDNRVKFELAPQSKVYDRKAFSFASNLIPQGASVAWFKGATPLSRVPTDVGNYIAKITIPAGNPSYLPGPSDVAVVIRPIVVTIYPDEQRKIKGKEDPSFTFSYDGTRWGDRVTGLLSRVAGEKVGNYPYLTDTLIAPQYYVFQIDPDSPMFFIDYSPHHFMPFDPLARIDPVYDEVVFSNGQKLSLMTNTVQKLNISGVRYGTLVTDTLDGKPRPFTPSLRLRPGYDAVLLILQAEPEMNEDGGYATDWDGKPIVRGRKMTLTYSHLQQMGNQRITHIAFGIGSTLCYLDLAELKNDHVTELMNENGVSRLGANFAVTVQPLQKEDDVPQTAPAARESVRLGQQLAVVRVEVQNGAARLDITSALLSARVLMDASAVLESESSEGAESNVSETVIGKIDHQQSNRQANEEVQEKADLDKVSAGLSGNAEPSVELFELAQQLAQKRIDRYGYSLLYYAEQGVKLDSQLVVPYTAFEAKTMLYTAIFRTKPYLTTPLAINGCYGLAALKP